MCTDNQAAMVNPQLKTMPDYGNRPDGTKKGKGFFYHDDDNELHFNLL